MHVSSWILPYRFKSRVGLEEKPTNSKANCPLGVSTSKDFWGSVFVLESGLRRPQGTERRKVAPLGQLMETQIVPSVGTDLSPLPACDNL